MIAATNLQQTYGNVAFDSSCQMHFDIKVLPKVNTSSILNDRIASHQFNVNAQTALLLLLVSDWLCDRASRARSCVGHVSWLPVANGIGSRVGGTGGAVQLSMLMLETLNVLTLTFCLLYQ